MLFRSLSRDLELASYAQQIKDHEGTLSNLKFALMKEEVPYQYMVAALNSKPLHPAAASLFLEFLLSKEAGKILEGSGYSAGQRRLEHLSRPKVWHWEMDSVSSMYEYQSYVARALRLLRDGGAKIEPVLRYGVPAFE